MWYVDVKSRKRCRSGSVLPVAHAPAHKRAREQNRSIDDDSRFKMWIGAKARIFAPGAKGRLDLKITGLRRYERCLLV